MMHITTEPGSPAGLPDSTRYEQSMVMARAIETVQFSMGCSYQEAIYLICRDWLEANNLPLVSDNRLAMMAQPPQKFTIWQHLRRFF